MIFPQSGLYAITQTENKTSEQVINDVNAAIKGGIQVLQYRDKQPTDALYLAGALKELCHTANIPLIINDQIELAKYIGADGVHIGKDDGQLNHARATLGKQAIIGVSCYNSLASALFAEQNSANYVAFGRFFPSNSKPLAGPASIDTLEQAKVTLRVPIVAIGGILPGNGELLLQAGADLLAVIGGIFTETPYQSALNYQTLFE